MKAVLQAVVIGAFLVLGACAKDSGGGNSDTAVVPAPNTCVAGQAYTNQYGCLSQGACPVNYVDYQGQCIIAQANACAVGQVNTQYGCLPQGICPVGQAQLNTQCVAATLGNTGYNGGYNSGYYGGNTGYNSGYYGNGGAYGGAYYGGGYNAGYNSGYYRPSYGYGGAGVGAGFGAGFYIGGGASAGVPGMYYGY